MTLQDEAKDWLARDPRLRRLTDRQQEVVRRLAAGESVAHIAAAWNLRPGSVANHVRAIRARMGTPRHRP